MANGSSRFLAVLLALVVGFVAAWFLKPPPRPTVLQAKHWTIFVGDKPCELNDELGNAAKHQIVSKKKGHHVFWQSTTGQALYLVFHVPPDCQPPFASLVDLKKTDSAGNKLYQLGKNDPTGPATLYSGKPDKDACECPYDTDDPRCEAVDPSKPGKWQIKYDQFLWNAKDNKFDECDGWIIIDK